VPKRSKPVVFEAALEELEQLVDRLERGELPLEESLAAFERGMGLVGSLNERLADIEQRVEALLATYDRAPAEEPDAEDGDG
jgi:exodeoxyribonuclease VII small subunit